MNFMILGLLKLVEINIKYYFDLAKGYLVIYDI